MICKENYLKLKYKYQLSIMEKVYAFLKFFYICMIQSLEFKIFSVLYSKIGWIYFENVFKIWTRPLLISGT